MRKILLVGNPNCGKTTLFNLLTASNERVGNWAGVTVAKTQSVFELDKNKFEILDLPGIYSLNYDDKSAQDVRITAQEVVKNDVSLIINVIDASHLERHLYLTTQLLELEIPLIIVINMQDLAKNKKITIDKDLLAKKLDCPVILLQANKNLGTEKLYTYLQDFNRNRSQFKLKFSAEVKQLIELNIAKSHLKNIAYFLACRQIETYNNEFDIAMADTRYTTIHEIVNEVQKTDFKKRDSLTAKLDNLVLNKFFALPIFIALMYLMFVFAINFGGLFKDFFDIATDAIFVKGVAYLLSNAQAPAWLITTIAYGLGRGINTTVSFIPVIFMMYLFLSLLESSGYMARAAFVIDRIMRFMGLPGKAFVPMIIGFGCNVPGIMAARTLESERDRILTILMSPFMSCSARLAIYVVFVSEFFQRGGQNIVASLYLVGILMAVFTGFIVKRFLLRGDSSPLIIELPTYQIPTLKFLAKDAFKRLRIFLVKAGKLIVPVCIILSIMENFLLHINGQEISIIAYVGQKLTPLFTPMGISKDNWPAVVGLITGTLAKEVVIGTLNTLYSHIGNLSQAISINDFNFFQEINNAFKSFYINLVNFADVFGNPLVASINKSGLNATANMLMAQSFHTKIAAYAYLLFVLLYIPCVSTMAAIKQETNRKYMWFAIIWSIVLAYFVACVFYQIASMVLANSLIHNTIFFIMLFILTASLIFLWRKVNALRVA